MTILLKCGHGSSVCLHFVCHCRFRVRQFDVCLVKIIVLDQRWRVAVENVHSQEGHLEVSVYDPIKFKVFVIVAKWIDELFS